IARGVFYNFAGYELCCPREERSFLGLYGYFDWSEVCAPSPASVASMNERHLFAEELDVAFCRLEVDDVFAVFDVFGLHGSWFLVEAFAGCGVGAFAFVLFSRSLQKLERIEVCVLLAHGQVVQHDAGVGVCYTCGAAESAHEFDVYITEGELGHRSLSPS